MANRNDTVCAISTPQGIGAIAVIRVSGPDALHYSSKLFKKSSSFDNLKNNIAKYEEIYDKEQLIDQVIVVKYFAPHSYTGENMVEISCHGSHFIIKKILEMLIQAGCRSAEAGEFTMRAFMNRKLDLPQAEAVSDLINSQTEASHKLAIKQLKGNISKKLEELRLKFVDLASMLELELDFSEEDVEFADRTQLLQLLSSIKSEVNKLIDSYKLGNNLKNGIPVAIVGEPNVGKSTLLNILLDEDRAIVSEIPGTTRDTIEEVITLDGISFRFIDTAGLRNSDNAIERIGIERSYKAIENAEIVLWLFDSSTGMPSHDNIENISKRTCLEGKNIIFIGNKIDKIKDQLTETVFQGHPLIYISAKEYKNINQLLKLITDACHINQLNDNTILTNVRHYDNLLRVNETIAVIEKSIASALPTDIIAIDVHAALEAIGAITGTVANEDILNNIFGKFCIGK
ncbi:MAG: tRNA uridine-5-carboxymethylaminomethyl(34) synthesis GTPase MnmE [Bacteroidales bacterium]|nr:tRNA uridine-5-carboxymethylaminomethyl(34) synthesis GTPase MnmE [Bacteroidales bacterium]